MSTSHDDENRMPRDVRDEQSRAEPLTLEQIVHTAPFPIYGLITARGDLTLQGFGYCTGDLHQVLVGLPTQSTLSHLPWQVALHYDFPPTHPRAGQRIDLFTTDTNHAPISTPQEHNQGSEYESRYPSWHDAPVAEGQAVSFVIEHFSLADGPTVARVAYTPHPLATQRVIGSQAHSVVRLALREVESRATPSPAVPVWSITFLRPGLWLEVCAPGWIQHEIFAVLEQLAIISYQPTVLAQYRHELMVWERHNRTSLPSA